LSARRNDFSHGGLSVTFFYVQASYAERPQRTSTDARHIPAGKRPQTLPSVAEEPAPNPRLSPGQPLARANPWGSFFERKWVHFS